MLLIGWYTGHHILLDVSAGDSLELQINTDTSTDFADRFLTYFDILKLNKKMPKNWMSKRNETFNSRDWRIRVTQLVCDPNMSGCFQYLTGRAGKEWGLRQFITDSLIRNDHKLQLLEHWHDKTASSRWDNVDWSQRFKNHFYVLAGMDYTICLRRETGHCCLLCEKLNFKKSLILTNSLFQTPCNSLPWWLGYERSWLYYRL